jgi:hypothetical protein
MKKTLLPILLLCLSAITVSAQVESNTTKTDAQKNAVEQTVKTDQPNPQADNPNAPVITFDKLVHDYGTIAQDADGTSEFKFTNDGKEPLILSNVRAS